MNTFISKTEPFRLGNLLLPNAIFYAPLAGWSDFPFRQMSAKFSPGLHYCEMVKMEAIVRKDSATLSMLEYCSEMRPIGAQLCGSNPSIAAEAARFVASLGFDVIDFNCGCPVDKVTKDGSGSAMLKTPEKIGEIISEMVAAVNIPVTVKVRAGWDESMINAPQIVEIAEAAGASAIAIHGRTRAQAYTGPANWDYIKACKQASKKIPVIGNGDIFEASAAKKMFEYTGCDIILVARGTMGQPWIAEDIISDLRGEKASERSLEWAREQLLDHFYKIVSYRKDNERKAILDLRRAGCSYIKKARKAREFRLKMSTATCLREVEEHIKTFPLIPAEGTEHHEEKDA